MRTLFFSKPKEFPVSVSKQFERNCKSEDFKKIQNLFKSEKIVKWLFAGDSITHGCRHTNNYPRFSEYFDFSLRQNKSRKNDIVYNTGVSGATTQDCIKYKFDWLERFEYDVCFICFGMNDCFKNIVSVYDFSNNIRQIVSIVREKGAVPVLQTPQTSSRQNYFEDYKTVLKKIADDEEILFVDINSYWQENIKVLKKFMSDSIHPNQYGHLLWAQILLKSLGLDSEMLDRVQYKSISKKIKLKKKDFSSVLKNEQVEVLLNYQKPTRWLLAGNFDSAKTFPKRTFPQNFEEFFRFNFRQSEMTDMMRFCSYIDTSVVDEKTIIDNFDVYVKKFYPDIIFCDKSSFRLFENYSNANDISVVILQ